MNERCLARWISRVVRRIYDDLHNDCLGALHKIEPDDFVCRAGVFSRVVLGHARTRTCPLWQPTTEAHRWSWYSRIRVRAARIAFAVHCDTGGNQPSSLGQVPPLYGSYRSGEGCLEETLTKKVNKSRVSLDFPERRG